MDKIKVDKNKLLAKLAENMEDHQKLLKVAREGWREKMILALEESLANAKAGKPFVTDFDGIEEPEDHTKAYSVITAQVEWSEQSIIELGTRDFNRFVLDIWEWMPNFLRLTQGYSSSSSSTTGSSSSSSTDDLLATKLALFS